MFFAQSSPDPNLLGSPDGPLTKGPHSKLLGLAPLPRHWLQLTAIGSRCCLQANEEGESQEKLLCIAGSKTVSGKYKVGEGELYFEDF